MVSMDIDLEYNGGMGKRILIVEDDHDIQRYYRMILSEMDLEIVPAYNGREALAIIDREHPVDLIILDIIMPVMDGVEFFKSLREDRGSTVPIIVSTVDEKSAGDLRGIGEVQGIYSKLSQISSLKGMIVEQLSL